MSYFEDLDAEAARLVGAARELNQSIAVGEPDPNDNASRPEASADADSATPTILWAPQRRVFFGELGSEAQRLVQQAQAPSEASEAPAEAAPSPPPSNATELPFGRRVNGLGPEILRLLNQINAAVEVPQQATPDLLSVRRSVYNVMTPQTATVVYAIGAYFLPKKPVLPVEDYWRQWDNLTKEQADDLVAQLRAANITPRYWDGWQWVTMVG